MSEEISLLLQRGHETIVRRWTEKVATDSRVRSDAQLTYTQLIDHVPQIVEELRRALASELPLQSQGRMMQEGREHGRQRWQQGYELKEVVRELTLLRATLMEFIENYRGALVMRTPEQISQSYSRISGFIDEEIYKTVEAYLEKSGESHNTGVQV